MALCAFITPFTPKSKFILSPGGSRYFRKES